MLKSNIIYNDIQNIVDDKGLCNEWSHLEGKTLLITGATGMIPVYLIHTLMALKNVKVFAVSRNEEMLRKKFLNYLDNTDFIVLIHDIYNPICISDSIDIIIHAASPSSPREISDYPVDTIRANIIGTENLLHFAQKNYVQKFLFLSSVTIYGKPMTCNELFTETDMGVVDENSRMSSYILSKRMGEYLCKAYYRQFKLKTYIGRISQTFGPGYTLYHGSPASDFIGDAVNNRNIIMKSTGETKRNYSYISDVITGLFYILLKGDAASPYNISDNNSYISTMEFAKNVVLASESNISINMQIEENDRSYNYGLNSNKLSALGWNPKVSIYDGLRKTIRFFKEENDA
jgi:nucleoside-diphosphate-sugar epimerase